jgi:hypothetical protein
VDNLLHFSPSRFADRVTKLLERVEHRRAETAEEKDAIYRMRYDAYLREGAIEPNASRRFTDPFDGAPNAWLIGTFIDGELASSLRIHVTEGDQPALPAKSVFPEAILPRLRAGELLVDPTRFVTRLDFSRRFHELPYLTVRPGWMAGEYFGADFIIATCRAEHQAYYRRVFGHENWCPPRDYPTLKKQLGCMGLDYRAMREKVENRYPFYKSTGDERFKLFSRSSNWAARAQEGAIEWNSEPLAPVSSPQHKSVA